MPSMKINVLYISIIGMSEPLGKSQVLEYLKSLSSEHDIYLHSFEKNTTLQVIKELQLIMDANQINWTYQFYSNKWGVLSSIIQIATSYFLLKRSVRKNRIRIIHARSMIPVVIAMLIKLSSCTKILFDIRGFQIDEKAEVGRLKHSSIQYRSLKLLEKTSYKRSDAIVSLTHEAKRIISSITDEKKITVIPTCANSGIFKRCDSRALKKELGYDNNDIVILHVGTVTNWYDFDAELAIVRSLISIDTSVNFLILNKGEHQYVDKKLKEFEMDNSSVRVIEVPFYEVYKYLNIADASLFFIPPKYSKRASAPTKFAENLCCDLYSITNNGVGDMDFYLKEYPEVGCSFDIKQIHQSPIEVAQQILRQLSMRERGSVQYELLYNLHMNSDLAIERYSNIYNDLVSDQN